MIPSWSVDGSSGQASRFAGFQGYCHGMRIGRVHLASLLSAGVPTGSAGGRVAVERQTRPYSSRSEGPITGAVDATSGVTGAQWPTPPTALSRAAARHDVNNDFPVLRIFNRLYPAQNVYARHLIQININPGTGGLELATSYAHWGDGNPSILSTYLLHAHEVHFRSYHSCN